MKLKRIVAALMTGVMVVGSSPAMGARIPVRASAVTMPDMVTNSAAAQPSKGIQLTEEGFSITFSAKMTTAVAWDSPQFAVYAAEDDTAKSEAQLNPEIAEGAATYFRARSDNYAIDATGNRWETGGKPLANGNSYVFTGVFNRDGGAEVTSQFTLDAYLLDGSAVISMGNESFQSVSRVALDANKKNYLSLIANFCDITNIQYSEGAHSNTKLANVASGAKSDRVEVLKDGTTVLSYMSQTDAGAVDNWLTPMVNVYNGDKADPIAKIRSDCYDDVNKDAYRVSSFGGEWTTWLARNKQGTGCFVTAKIEGEKLIITVGDNTFGSVSTFPSVVVDVSKPVYLELFGNVCTLTDINVSDISRLVLNKKELEISKGSTAEITTADGTLPTDAVISGAVSSDEEIATVQVTDGKAVVTGVAGGTARITVTGSNRKQETVPVSVKVPLESISFKTDSVSLTNKKVKDTDKIQFASDLLSDIVFNPEDTTDDKTVTYTSSNPQVVEVEESGKITAVAEEGTADITAAAGGKTAVCKVTVTTELVDSIVLAESITIIPAEYTLKAGETVQLEAAILPENVTSDTCTWESSNMEIATVNAKGLVTGIKEGTVTITATTDDDAKKMAECKITVSNAASIPVTGITLDKTKLDLEVGGTADLKASITPDTAANKTVIWTSSDEALAKVENGKVTALKAGIVTITAASADNPEIKAECTVTIKEAAGEIIRVTGITLDKTAMELKAGETGQLTAAVAPADATNKEVEWVSEEPAIAAVDSMGKVTAVKAGKTKVHAISKSDKTISADCVITVTTASTGDSDNKNPDGDKKPDPNPGPGTNGGQQASISLSKTNVTLYTGKAGNSVVVKPTVQGTTAAVSWTSSNKKIATVTGGTIKAVKKGTTVITAAVNGVSATVKVTVKNPSIKVKKGKKAVSKVTVKRKKSVKLTVTVSPAKSGMSLAKLSAKNKKIAKVTFKKGRLTIKGKKKGKLTLKIKSGKGVKSFKVTVK